VDTSPMAKKRKGLKKLGFSSWEKPKTKGESPKVTIGERNEITEPRGENLSTLNNKKSPTESFGKKRKTRLNRSLSRQKRRAIKKLEHKRAERQAEKINQKVRNLKEEQQSGRAKGKKEHRDI